MITNKKSIANSSEERRTGKHEVKVLPQFVKPIVTGRKQFEIRYNDRDYRVGDKLILKEWDEEKSEFTGVIIDCSITYLLKGGQYGIEPRYVVLGIKLLGTNA